jgi:hypothetical protein
LETFSLTNQTVKKNWKLFNVLSKQFKKFGNFFTLLALEILMAENDQVLARSPIIKTCHSKTI